MKVAIKQEYRAKAFKNSVLLKDLQDCTAITLQQCTVDCMKTLHTILTQLSQLQHLEQLKFVANRFDHGVEGPFKLLLPLLLRYFPRLDTLIFNTEALDTRLAQLLIELGCKKKFKTLKMINCGIDDAVMTILPKRLKFGVLETLSFANNNLTDEGAIDLFSALPNSKITELDISSNLLTNKSLLYLVQILPETKLKVIKCQSIPLDRLFIEALIQVITKNSLTTLDFSDCDLSEECLFLLIEAITGSACTIENIITSTPLALEKIRNLPKNKQVRQNEDKITLITLPSLQQTADVQTDFFKNPTYRVTAPLSTEINLNHSSCMLL